MIVDTDNLLPAIQAGDTDAFAAWMARAEPRIRASLASFATAADTEAVMQGTLLRVWQVARRFTPDGQPESLTRFAVRTARNLAIAETRRRHSSALTDDMLRDATEEFATTSGPDMDHLRAAIAGCLEALAPKPREAMAARLAAPGVRDRFIAATVRMTVNTFLQNITRARAALAECLRRHGIDLGFGP